MKTHMDTFALRTPLKIVVVGRVEKWNTKQRV